jgi:outer membrane receptor for ferrienterochelin and colicin
MKYEHYNIITHIFTCFLLLLLLPIATFAVDVNGTEQRDLFDLSITELMEIKIDVPATITEKNPLKTPASVTVITAEDIARTPARNLLDLLEVYVPRSHLYKS